MKTHYELFGLDPAAGPEEIKRAFRREIARYHPDKVQHLGHEFQHMAAERAAALTAAYRVLMDAAQREAYDRSLSDDGAARPAPVPPPVREEVPPRPTPEAPASKDRSVRSPVESGFDFLRKATLAKVRNAIQAAADVEPVQIAGFELAYTQGKKGLFKRAGESQRLLVRLVPDVNPDAVADVWPLARRAGTSGTPVCVLLMGPALAPQQDLAAAVSAQRRRSRSQGPVLVPVDVRDWEALFPPDTPAVARAAIQRLRAGD
ncbi:MAG TPA: DnaJ domain-containing protein [Vicinamibacterales bacterium]|nr:DnaJ domain-containing protein [Vicinamibacterales bacterium]